MAESTDVVVIGGGYAGVMAANRLTGRDDVTVTLINPRATFVERIRLHQLAGGSDDAVVDYREVLAASVRLVVDTATRIDAAGRLVTLASGDAVGYDYLIYAVGSAATAPPSAFPIATLQAWLTKHPRTDHPEVSLRGAVLGAAVVLQTDRGEFTLPAVERFT